MSLRTLLLKRQGISTPVTGQLGGTTLITLGSINIVAGSGITITQADTTSTDVTTLTVSNTVATDSGTYTPTLTNVTNVAASTARLSSYLRVGDTVTVSGQVDIDVTLTATATELGISLPIASAFTTAYQCAGVAAATAIVSLVGGIISDATNDRASLNFVYTDTANDTWVFQFTYRVI